MSKPVHDQSLSPAVIRPAVRTVGLLLGTCLLLQGCVVRVAAPPPPPPPRVYVAPPPAAYVAAPEEEIQTNEAPPPLPDYDQPQCPEDGYIWTPGYWRWAGGAYFWVPGTWVQPPRVGVLWTPGYWGFVGGVYAFHAGYWGPHVGFYGGVNYGYGYGGVGFAGGRWAGNSFAYNSTVTNVNVTVIHNTYNQTVINNVTVNKVSYNGGSGGVVAAPSAQERVAAQETHVPPTALQRQHVQEAVRNPALSARVNGGHPTIAATARPAAFSGPGVVQAHGAAPGAAFGATPHGGNPSPGAQHGPATALNNSANGAHPNGQPGQPGRPGQAGQPNGNPGGNRNVHPNGQPNGQPNGNGKPPKSHANGKPQPKDRPHDPAKDKR
jgi:hypothetical protein